MRSKWGATHIRIRELAIVAAITMLALTALPGPSVLA